MFQWNCSRRKACACRAVCGRALSCNRTNPRKSLPLRQDNLRSHRLYRKRITLRTSQSAVFSIGTAKATAISALTTLQGSTYNCMRHFHHTKHKKPMIGCNKTGARTVLANVIYFLDDLSNFKTQIQRNSKKQDYKTWTIFLFLQTMWKRIYNMYNFSNTVSCRTSFYCVF